MFCSQSIENMSTSVSFYRIGKAEGKAEGVCIGVHRLNRKTTRAITRQSKLSKYCTVHQYNSYVNVQREEAAYKCSFDVN